MPMPRLAVGVLCLAALAGCTVGSGNVTSETRDVAPFTEIVLSTSGTVNVAVTGAPSLRIDAEDNILPRLTSKVVDGRLELASSGSFTTSRGITYTITAANLTGVSVSGSGSVNVDGVDGAVFHAIVSGSGSVHPAGSSQRLDVTISGSGSFEGADLQATTGSVGVTGSGEATVNVSDTLTVLVSGSGRVRYLGDPTLDQHISGSGSVSRQ